MVWTHGAFLSVYILTREAWLSLLCSLAHVLRVAQKNRGETGKNNASAAPVAAQSQRMRQQAEQSTWRDTQASSTAHALQP